MEQGTKEFRNEYDRYILKLLIREYYISRPELSKAIGLTLSFVREFDNGTRTFGATALDQFEELVYSKYEPLLKAHEFDLEQIKQQLESIETDEQLEDFRLNNFDMI
ncbi:XRE family transcriptional regulator [Enterococcus avium]|uniref:XRE family transcriptional regulator n=1 Tax=Enterococcus avium TaxID=33945 RepID=UPI001F563CD6|nr:XRE family transcriptional regulator [Enterococcus avium]